MKHSRPYKTPIFPLVGPLGSPESVATGVIGGSTQRKTLKDNIAIGFQSILADEGVDTISTRPTASDFATSIFTGPGSFLGQLYAIVLCGIPVTLEAIFYTAHQNSATRFQDAEGKARVGWGGLAVVSWAFYNLFKGLRLVTYAISSPIESTKGAFYWTYNRIAFPEPGYKPSRARKVAAAIIGGLVAGLNILVSIAGNAAALFGLLFVALPALGVAIAAKAVIAVVSFVAAKIGSLIAASVIIATAATLATGVVLGVLGKISQFFAWVGKGIKNKLFPVPRATSTLAEATTPETTFKLDQKQLSTLYESLKIQPEKGTEESNTRNFYANATNLAYTYNGKQPLVGSEGYGLIDHNLIVKARMTTENINLIKAHYQQPLQGYKLIHALLGQSPESKLSLETEKESLSSELTTTGSEITRVTKSTIVLKTKEEGLPRPTPLHVCDLILTETLKPEEGFVSTSAIIKTNNPALIDNLKKGISPEILPSQPGISSALVSGPTAAPVAQPSPTPTASAPSTSRTAAEQAPPLDSRLLEIIDFCKKIPGSPYNRSVAEDITSYTCTPEELENKLENNFLIDYKRFLCDGTPQTTELTFEDAKDKLKGKGITDEEIKQISHCFAQKLTYPDIIRALTGKDAINISSNADFHKINGTVYFTVNFELNTFEESGSGNKGITLGPRFEYKTIHKLTNDGLILEKIIPISENSKTPLENNEITKRYLSTPESDPTQSNIPPPPTLTP